MNLVKVAVGLAFVVLLLFLVRRAFIIRDLRPPEYTKPPEQVKPNGNQEENEKPEPVNKEEEPPVTTTSNPFGIMISGKQMNLNKKLQVAKDLGAVYYRTADVDVENGSSSCDECQQALNSGFKLILTVRNGGGGGKPSTPPSDINGYKNTTKTLIEKYKPEVLVVENEENSQALFYSGTPAQYHNELKAACEVAHSLNTKCANGGLVGSLVAILTAYSYEEAGNSNQADDYLKRTLNDDQYALYKRGGFIPMQSQIQRGKDLIAGYKQAGADYINYHWYADDHTAISEAVRYLEQKSGLKAMTNETGQKNKDAQQVTNTMQTLVNLGIPYAVWFSVDIPRDNGAFALTETDGTLRPSGIAFKNFIETTFK